MVSTVASFFTELQAHMETIMSTARTSANTFFILLLHIFFSLLTRVDVHTADSSLFRFVERTPLCTEQR